MGSRRKGVRRIWASLFGKRGLGPGLMLGFLAVLMGLSLSAEGFGAPAGSALNVFTCGRLDIALEEESFTQDILAVPGMMIPKDPVIRNQGEVDAVVFMEVEIPRARLMRVSDFERQEEELLDLFSFTVREGWTLMESSSGESYSTYLYAYDQTLEAGQVTVPLFDALETVNYLEGSFWDGQQVHVKVRARAIQAGAAQGTRQETYALYLRDAQD